MSETTTRDSIPTSPLGIDAIKAEIEACLGGPCPTFFLLARDSPEVVTQLWQHAKFAYFDNAIPNLFKQRLFAYLSRFCDAPYCVTRHSAILMRPNLNDGAGKTLSACEVVALLQRPMPDADELESAFQTLSERTQVLDAWPEPGSALEQSVFTCAVAVFLRHASRERCESELRRGLGSVWYNRLLTFLCFARSAHFWTETHSELEIESDVLQLVQEHQQLAAWLGTYQKDVKQELYDRLRSVQGRRQQLCDSLTKSRCELQTVGSEHAVELTRVESEKREAAAAAHDVLIRDQATFEGIVRSIPDGLVLADLDRRISYCNERVEVLFGYQPCELIGQSTAVLYADYNDFEQQGKRRYAPDAVRQESPIEVMMRRKNGETFPVELVGTILQTARGNTLGYVGLIRDVTLRNKSKVEQQRYYRVLESLSSGTSLDELLALVVRLAQEERPKMIGSIMLLDESKQTLRTAYASELPGDYVNAIDGLPVGEGMASCGTAVNRCERVIVEDIATSPLWAGYRKLAQSAGLRACWSKPIRSLDNEIVGTIAMYFREPMSASESDINLLKHSAQLAGIVIDRARKAIRLRKSEQRFQSLVKASSNIIWTMDRKGEFCAPHSAWEQFTGQSWEEHRGWGWLRMLHPADHDRVAQAWLGVLDQPKFFTVQCRLWHAATNDYHHVVSRSLPVFDTDGSVLEWVGATTDIHEQVVAQEQLQQREREFRMLADNVPELFSYVDMECRYRFVNRRYEKAHGRRRDEIVGRHVRDLVGDETYETSIRPHLDRALAGERVAFENTFAPRDGDVRWMATVLIPDIDLVENVRGVFALTTDMTEHRLLEKSVLDTAAEENRRIGNDLHDGVGQELTGLAMLADALAVGLARKSLPEAGLARKVEAGIKDALGQIRSLSRGMNPVDIDAQGLMSSLSEMSHHLRIMYGVDCTFRCEGPVLLNDNQSATQLFRIAQEATTNAVKHGKAKHIEVSLERVDRVAILRVRDDGIGIAVGPQDKLGMGLRTMGYRAGMIGGDLRIVSLEGGGTEVSCTLRCDAEHRGQRCD